MCNAGKLSVLQQATRIVTYHFTNVFSPSYLLSGNPTLFRVLPKAFLPGSSFVTIKSPGRHQVPEHRGELRVRTLFIANVTKHHAELRHPTLPQDPFLTVYRLNSKHQTYLCGSVGCSGFIHRCCSPAASLWAIQIITPGWRDFSFAQSPR